MATDGKKHLGVVICGHIDAGKSSLTGHLLFKLGGIDERTMTKLQAEADANGKSSFAFAYFMDRQKDERERGVTISCTTKEFFTDRYHYSIIDAPGHRDFVKNMISGASQADVAVLMVPANKGGFETSIARGNRASGEIEGQTRQHARLINLLGIEQVVVGINKMDDTSVDYSEARYEEIKGEVRKMLEQAGYKKTIDQIPFIPMSGFRGENLIEKSDKMPWYKGFSIKKGGNTVEGFSLIDALDKLMEVPKRNADGALRAPISGIFKIKGVGDVITSRIEQGVMTPGMQVKFMPSGVTGKIFSIEMHHKSVEKAHPGDNVGLNMKNLSGKPFVGDVLVDAKDTSVNAVERFTMQAMIQEHPGQLKAGKDGKGGFTPVVHVRTCKCPCRLARVNWKMGKSTGKQKVEDADFVEKGDVAELVFEPKMPMFVDSFKNCEGLGRVAVMDSNSLVMLGKVIDVVYKAK